METRWRCRSPASLAGLRPRCGFVTSAGRRRSAARDRAADRAARGLQHAAILRFERRRTMRDGFFALIQFR
ncbi:hypothetical protein WI90_16275 [Burkholderia ubonensis]|nr:hypothetical protein WI90_16275 [Burkholderia ubonensis]